jgi:hypothetical protein
MVWSMGLMSLKFDLAILCNSWYTLTGKALCYFSPGSTFCIPQNSLVSRGCSVVDPTPCVGLYPMFALNISPSFAMASWTVAATKQSLSGLENLCWQRAVANAPMT